MAQPKPKTTRKTAKKQVRKPAKQVRSVKQIKKPVKASSRAMANKTKQVRKPAKSALKAKRSNKSSTRSKAGVKATSKSAKRQVRKPAKASAKKKSSKQRAYSPRLLVVSVVLAGITGMFYGHQIWVKGYANILGSNLDQASRTAGKVTTPGPRQTSPLFSTYPAWSQNFADDSSGKLDSKYWNIFKGVPQSDNHEAQYYTDNPTNLHIKDGALSLMATHQAGPDGYKYLSARVDTQHKVSFLYGRIDVTAKVPNGVGTWPAVWFLPSNNKYADLGSRGDSFRYLNGGELDLIEEVGFNPNIEYGIVHTKSDVRDHTDGVGTFNQVEVLGNDVHYNKYSMLWTPNSITFEVNDTPFFTYDRPPGADYNTWAFDQPFYMIMNLAMGGKWGGEDTAHFPGNGIDDSALPASLDIKSIYYYPYIQAPH
jgi:beta-glucanase (GH16 family)